MNRNIILGMGAGQCGMQLLAQILSKQPHSHFTHEQPPLLPWEQQSDAPGIHERLQRILATTKERFVGDVASFYLPYVEEAIRFEPAIRIICLQRPENEIVAGFCRHLDQSSRVPINHWAKVPAPGWSHDPCFSRIYPQYDTADREEGIRRYWNEYYTAAERLQQKYPQNVRIWDTEVLTTDAGVREVLTFAGFPPSEHVILTGQKPQQVNGDAPAPGPGRSNYQHPLDPRRCVVLVPFSGFIHQECEAGLKELERRGYPLRRVGGYANIDVGRSQMVTDALRDGFEETFWIDSDVGFDPNDVEKLRAHNLPMVCGIYPQKGKRALACHVMPGTQSMTFGKNGGLVELLYAATGFLLVRREVYIAIQEKTKLPMCNERFGHPMVPYFLSLIRPIEDGYWYLADDYAFCHRARECGYRIFADTTIRLWHVGQYRYGWEDAGMDRPRFDSFSMNFGDQRPAEPADRSVAEAASVGAVKDLGNARPPASQPPAENGDVPSAAWPGLDQRVGQAVPDEATYDARANGTAAAGWPGLDQREAPVHGAGALDELTAQFHWPAEKPDVPAPPERDWLYPATRDLLAKSVPSDSRLIVELGSWTGRSTRYLADLAPQASVVAIDHWKGSVEHVQDPELAEFLPRLFDTFLAECWEYRDRIIPMRSRSVEGLRRVAAAGLRPDLVFIDADHQFDGVVADLTAALDLFPETPIVGDDWDWAGVRSAVETVARQRNLPVEVTGTAWRIPKPR